MTTDAARLTVSNAVTGTGEPRWSWPGRALLRRRRAAAVDPELVSATADHFRADLEGLRAVAVILVLLYHAGVPGFAGGYIGVDVFFVLSGFLITGLILREIQATGTLSLAGFYARRARRLLPAAGVALLVTLVASVVILPPTRIGDVATDIASAAVYVSNMRFGIQANDYFQAGAAPSPVLHFWSLSVEEQFYIFWPTIVYGLFRLGRRTAIGRHAIVAGVAVVSLLSFVACVWLTGQNQAWAFYLLPTRAWELGLGALIAVGAARLASIPPKAAAAAVVTGLALIVVASVAFTDDTLFPGIAASIPVVGAGLVIMGGVSARGWLPSRTLALPTFRYLGQISYSVYLWHWPMLVLGAALWREPLPLALSVAIAGASIPVAALTQRLIEQPFRVGRFIGVRPRINLAQALLSSLIIVVASAGATMVQALATPPAIADLIPPLAAVKNFKVNVSRCSSPEQVDNFQLCVAGVPQSDVAVVLFGDSHAFHWYPALEVIALERGWRLVTMTQPRCPAVMITWYVPALGGPDPQCDVWREHAFARIAAERPAVVVTSGFGPDAIMIDDQVVRDRSIIQQAWADGLAQTLGRLGSISGTIAVIGDIPAHQEDVPNCLSRNPDNFEACSVPVQTAPRDWHAIEQAAAAQAGATFIDPTPWLCGADRCRVVLDRVIVYRDQHHMTEPFAESLAPRLAAVLPFTPVSTATSVPISSTAASSIGLADLIPPIEQARSRTGPGWCPQSEVADVHACVYDDDPSLPTVVLFGDETAQQWYPALVVLSSTRSFRLVSLTTPRCPSASLTVWPTEIQSPNTACDAWREAAFERIGAESPAMVIIANRPGYTVVVDGQPLAPATEGQAAAWRSGLRATLERLAPAPTVLIGSVPSFGDVPRCLSEHPTNFLACSRQRDKVVGELNHEIDSSEAAAAGATFIDPIPWLCDSTTCPPVLDEYLVYDFLSLLTAPFSESLAPELDLALPAIGQAR